MVINSYPHFANNNKLQLVLVLDGLLTHVNIKPTVKIF